MNVDVQAADGVAVTQSAPFRVVEQQIEKQFEQIQSPVSLYAAYVLCILFAVMTGSVVLLNKCGTEKLMFDVAENIWSMFTAFFADSGRDDSRTAIVVTFVVSLFGYLLLMAFEQHMMAEMSVVVRERELNRLEDFFEPEFAAMEPAIIKNLFMYDRFLHGRPGER